MVGAAAGETQSRAAEENMSFCSVRVPSMCLVVSLVPSLERSWITLSSAETWHKLSPGPPSTHISTSRVLKNTEDDISCGRYCVAILMEADGIGRKERAIT